MESPLVWIIFYSHSGQTRKLADGLRAGLEEAGVRVRLVSLHPLTPPHFPLPSLWKALAMMLSTLFVPRYSIEPVSLPEGEPDLVILGGPTWSFNPSGPILSFLDREGRKVLGGREVRALISCRGYWRLHWAQLRRRIRAAGGIPQAPLVFTHPQPEPWRSLGVFLTLAGKHPLRLSLFRSKYRRFGHSADQIARAQEEGRRLGEALRARKAESP